MRVATYSTTGMHRGRVVVLRNVEGKQRWRVHVVTKKDIGGVMQIDERDIRSYEKCSLSDIAVIVIKQINEIAEDGEDIDARMDFFIAKP